MKLFVIAAMAVYGVLLIRAERRYEATRHEFYQVWDSMEDLKPKPQKEGQ